MILRLSGIIIISLLVIYIVALRKNQKIQVKIIEEQKDLLSKEKISHKYTKSQFENIYGSYIELMKNFNDMINERQEKPSLVEKVTQEYNMDDILNEIAIKGIKNVSKDKLDYLRKYGKK